MEEIVIQEHLERGVGLFCLRESSRSTVRRIVEKSNFAVSNKTLCNKIIYTTIPTTANYNSLLNFGQKSLRIFIGRKNANLHNKSEIVVRCRKQLCGSVAKRFFILVDPNLKSGLIKTHSTPITDEIFQTSIN